MKNLKFEFIAILFAIISIAFVSAATDNCGYVGQQPYPGFYCNESLNAAPLMQIGASCNNGFECLNGSCLEGICSTGYKREIQAKQGILQDIVNLLKGQVPAGYKKINATSPASYNASEIGLPANSLIDSVRITTTKDSEATLTYDDLGTAKPVNAGVSAEPPGKIYKYVSLATYKDISADVSSAEINIKISKSWFELNKADKEKIKIYRWSNGQWSELITSRTGETLDYFTYKATSPGFSIFAVTAGASSTVTITGQASCSDGIQNQGETGIDCGGPCNSCPTTCGNGIRDSSENCESCSLDSPCLAPQICKYRQCINKPFPFWTILAIAGAVVIVFFFSFRAVKHSGDAKRREIARLSSAIEYAMSASKMSLPENEVKINLTSAGWNEKQIKTAMNEAQKRLK